MLKLLINIYIYIQDISFINIFIFKLLEVYIVIIELILLIETGDLFIRSNSHISSFVISFILY